MLFKGHVGMQFAFFNFKVGMQFSIWSGSFLLWFIHFEKWVCAFFNQTNCGHVGFILWVFPFITYIGFCQSVRWQRVVVKQATGTAEEQKAWECSMGTETPASRE
jgi:hypothetical protein